MAEVVAEAGAGAVLMHMRGVPADMSRHAHYDDVCAEVAAESARAVARARAAGIADAAVVVDPGIGFAKTAAHSLALLGDLGPLRALGFPILVGPSRKSFLGAVLGRAAGGAARGDVGRLRGRLSSGGADLPRARRGAGGPGIGRGGGDRSDPWAECREEHRR